MCTGLVICINSVILSNRLDRFMLQILARENAVPEARQGMASVQIDISNVNDNFPMFSSNTYEFEVTEGAAAGALTSTMPAGLTMVAVSFPCVPNV